MCIYILYVCIYIFTVVIVRDDICFVGCVIVCRISVIEINKGGFDFRVTDNVFISCDCCFVL